MILSIRSKLLTTLCVLLTALIGIIGYWNYQNTRAQLIALFDSQLIQQSLTLRTLYQQLHTDPTFSSELLENLFTLQRPLNEALLPALPEDFAAQQLPQLFQIWDANPQKLIQKSKLAPSTPLTYYQPGLHTFSNRDHSLWRVFTLLDEEQNIFYVIAEPSEIRSMLVDNIALAQSVPMAILWVILLVLSAIGIYSILKPLERISTAIAQRNPDYLIPIDNSAIPLEIQPMVAQMNHLLMRLEEGLAREKRFTADASHELRTPLAALKVQVQVAMASTDELTRNKALEKIILAVDRCTHLIEQLLTLARIKPQGTVDQNKSISLVALAKEVIADLVPEALLKNIEIDFSITGTQTHFLGNPILLGIMIRNIIDNAIRYSPSSTEIKIEIMDNPQEHIFKVTDQGPGIPVEEQERIFERFYRGNVQNIGGSGLGLAIVQQIAHLHHAKIKLTLLKPHGLSFAVIFPKRG